MSFMDNVRRVWTSNTIRLSKEQLYQWRDADWNSNSSVIGLITTVVGITGLFSALGFAAFATSTGMTYAGLGGYIGNRIDNILRNNNCENGVNVYLQVEVTSNVTDKTIKKAVVTDIKV